MRGRSCGEHCGGAGGKLQPGARDGVQEGDGLPAAARAGAAVQVGLQAATTYHRIVQVCAAGSLQECLHLAPPRPNSGERQVEQLWSSSAPYDNVAGTAPG